MRRDFSRILLLLIGIGLTAFNLEAQPSEFDPGGFNSMRIENEIKLVVPQAETDAVWKYLQQRYDNSNLYIREIDSSFNSKFAEDIFRDQYFDNDTFQLVSMKCGVRHRTRVVLTDTTSRKNGRELLQIKINNIDGNQLNRAEFKYPIKNYSEGERKKKKGDFHPLLGLVKRKSRPDLTNRLAEYGINAEELVPTILIVQDRKRIYILKDTVPFATLTLDIDSAYYRGDYMQFTELEMELNEIGYTVSDSAQRVEMERINDIMKKDLMDHFPSIHQDQTPKYNKAALVFGIDPKNGKYGKPRFPTILVLVGSGVLLIALGVWQVRRRKKRSLPS